jgi:hypothetical protein
MQLTKRAATRLLIAAVCVAVTQVAVWQVKYHTGLQAAQGAKFDVTALPRQLGEWSGEPADLDPRVFRQVGGYSMLNQMYGNELGRQVSVHVANFSTADLLIPHPPDLCYAKAGWTIVSDVWHADSRDRRYRLMFVQRDGARVCVAYWYQMGAAAASNREELRKILLKLRAAGKPWPPLIKVLIQIPVDLSADDARLATEDLGFRIYEWIRTKS